MTNRFTSYNLAGVDPNPMTVAEVDALKSIMHSLPINPVVIQIGAERGCSTLAMLEERHDTFIFSIDIGERPEERANLTRAQLNVERVVRGLGKSKEIGFAWPDYWTCDLLFIDGDHRRPAIDNDIIYWTPALKYYGYLVFHDYIPNPPAHIHGRVAEAVDQWYSDVGNEDYEKVSLVNRLLVYRKIGERYNV